MFSPSQKQAYLQILESLETERIIAVSCRASYGQTTILERVSKEQKIPMIRLADFFDEIKELHPLQLEEGVVNTIFAGLKANDKLIVDDFGTLSKVFSNCYEPARPKILELALDAVLKWIESENKQLILGVSNTYPPAPLYKVAKIITLQEFTVEDFRILFPAITKRELSAIDFKEVHRFVPRLNTSQMKRAAVHLKDYDCENTDHFLKFLERNALVSNVNIGEVEKVDFNALSGVDDVIRQLDINIITPLERNDLTEKLGLKPKRGVLLYGPPGTGKTTIGRALAHRLRSKFFLIDGTVISGTSQFYNSIHQIFSKAKENAPSVVFIDDCDLLFENEEEPGLYRYLLTMLDGLESESNSQITLVLTAMNIGSLPPALIRSGRVELWLEMNLPDIAARAAILKNQIEGFVLKLSKEELQKVAQQTDAFTGADLKRVVIDAKNLYGYDLASEVNAKTLLDYFEAAIVQLQKHREQLERAPAFTAAHQSKTNQKGLGN